MEVLFLFFKNFVTTKFATEDIKIIYRYNTGKVYRPNCVISRPLYKYLGPLGSLTYRIFSVSDAISSHFRVINPAACGITQALYKKKAEAMSARARLSAQQKSGS